VESLNAAAAVSVALYEWRRSTKTDDPGCRILDTR
jgi:tRNA G18 (ribose-2'-O)-methylase SpoU